MASNDGDQSPAKDLDETQSLISEADSGFGLSFADVSSLTEEENEDLGEEDPGMAVTETDTQQDGQTAPAQEPYGREIASQEGENEELYDGDSPETTTKIVVQTSDTTKRDQGEDVAWQLEHNRFVGPAPGIANVSVNRVYKHHHDGELTATGDQQQNFEGGDTLSRFHLEEPLPGNQVLQAASSVPQKRRRFSYSRSEDVPKEVLEEMKKRAREGKSAPVREFWSTVSNHLQEFEEVEDCNFLPLENGVLITSSEVTSQNLTGPTVQLELKESRRGTVLLYAAVSPDKAISYGPSATYQYGKFTTLKKIGEGSEGEVYIANDGKTRHYFVAKQVSLQKFGKTNPAAFLQLNDCPQVCKPFGLILDEEGECVYFLMERLRGNTLKRMLNSGDEIPTNKAVDICIEIMKALSYIHSKGMVHRDVKESNVMSDGTNATVLDITGVGKAEKYSQLAQDTVMAVKLLNEMLWPPGSRSEGAVWTPSDEDQKNYPKEALQDLKKIVEMQMKEVPSMDHATVKKLLEDLQSISRRLSGATNVAQHQGATCSSSDADPAQGMTQLGSTSSSFDSKDIPSPYFDKDELMKKMEALQAERDNCSRELVEAQKKITDQEEQIQQMEKEHKDDFTRVNKKRMELRLKVKFLQDENETLRLMTELENLKAVLKKERKGRMETGEIHGHFRQEMEFEVLKDKEGASKDDNIMEWLRHGEDTEEIVQRNPGDTFMQS